MAKKGEKTEEAKQDEAMEELVESEDIVDDASEMNHAVYDFEWKPKTEIGRKVASGEITDIDVLFRKGIKIPEPEIVDILLPNLESETIFIGGSTGKGGGIRRTVTRRTTRMHKSGRRYTASAMVVIGNKDGYVGMGFSQGPPGRQQELMNKALRKAKLNIIPVRRGCGSWECRCDGAHSIPMTVVGKAGSAIVELKPAPKGIGLCVSDELKKVLLLAGIKDVWSKTRGQTQTRINLIRAVFDALSILNRFKISSERNIITGRSV